MASQRLPGLSGVRLVMRGGRRAWGAGACAGVGEERGDDARRGVGDGGRDGGLVLVGAVGGVDVEGGLEDLPDLVRRLVEDAGGVGELSDKRGRLLSHTTMTSRS